MATAEGKKVVGDRSGQFKQTIKVGEGKDRQERATKEASEKDKENKLAKLRMIIASPKKTVSEGGSPREKKDCGQSGSPRKKTKMEAHARKPKWKTPPRCLAYGGVVLDDGTIRQPNSVVSNPAVADA